jgi:hypothetical protein
MEKTEIVTVLTAMRENAWGLYMEEKKSHKTALRNRYYGEYSALDNAIRMLTDDAYAAKMAAIFCKEEQK